METNKPKSARIQSTQETYSKIPDHQSSTRHLQHRISIEPNLVTPHSLQIPDTQIAQDHFTSQQKHLFSSSEDRSTPQMQRTSNGQDLRNSKLRKSPSQASQICQKGFCSERCRRELNRNLEDKMVRSFVYGGGKSEVTFQTKSSEKFAKSLDEESKGGSDTQGISNPSVSQTNQLAVIDFGMLYINILCCF